jgi:hypothetical protein
VTNKGQSASDHRLVIPAFRAPCGRVTYRNRGLTSGTESLHLPSLRPQPCISPTGLARQASGTWRQCEYPQTVHDIS